MDTSRFSLLDRPWIPVRRADGRIDLIRPADLTADLSGNPVTALDWPRPDLRVGCHELLIGLLTTACPLEDPYAWTDWWQQPPQPAQLEEAFAPLASAFVLDGEGPRFLQDIGELPGESQPIERLFIDTPGENAVKKNTDLLVKQGRFTALGRGAAAMALFTLQAFAPAGGAGHRTSLRGGGPLTTLVVPRRAAPGRPLSLWHLLWANVLVGERAPLKDLRLVFPWLGPTRRSDAGGGGTLLDGKQAHPLQAFWGMPRRMRLDFTPAEGDACCDLTGQADTTLVTGFRTRPGGVQYLSAARLHPLSPCYRTKSTEPWLAVHPQPGGIGYRHWHGLVVANEAETTMPAAVVVAFHDRAGDIKPMASEVHLFAAGYDMDNMKPRGFVEAEMPLFSMPSAEAHRSFLRYAERLAQAATEAGRLLANAMRTALAERAEMNATMIDAVRLQFFEVTTAPFWQALEEARNELESGAEIDPTTTGKAWVATLRRHAFGLFDEAAPLNPLDPRSAGRLKGNVWQPPPVVEARRWLAIHFAGAGEGKKLMLILGLQAKASAKRKKVKT
jgi:CRISPR system Cascade subunit CasA